MAKKRNTKDKKTIEIPWFPKELKANSRLDRRFTGNVRRKYKADCAVCAKGKKIEGDTITIIFHPPCNRRRDLDNMLSSIKYGLDAICEEMGIDDSQFTKKLIIKSFKVKGGSIIIKEGLTE